MKDKALFFGWIVGLLLLISLLWILTTPLQANYLLRSVNNVLNNNNDSRRLSGFIKNHSGKAGPFGFWYSVQNSNDKMYVFGAFQDGILIPLGAVVADNGEVNEIIPLSAHAAQVFNELPESILQMYKNRIKGNME